MTSGRQLGQVAAWPVWLVWLLLVGSASPILAQPIPIAELESPQLESPQDVGLKSLARQARDSVVLLQMSSATGSPIGTATAFYVGPGLLATNYHVIVGAARVEAVLADSRVLTVAGVVAQDPHYDLALLQVADEAAGAAVLKLYDGDTVEPGEDVVVLGNPAGLSGTLSTGIVSAVRAEGVDAQLPGPLLQITAPISPGSSGSPVMNLRGEVLGVAVAVYRTGQNLNFAVPAVRLRALMASADPAHTVSFGGSLAPAKVALGRNLLISILLFGGLVLVLRRLR